MKKINILNVLGSLDVGGAESRLMDILRRIDKVRFQFDFVVHSQNSYYEKEALALGAKIHKIKRFRILNYLSYKKSWIKILENSNYDVIHGHTIVTGFIYFKIAKKNNINTRIAHSRSGSKNGFLRGKFIDKSIKEANHYLAVSRLSGQVFFGFNNKFNVINNPFDLNKYSFNRENREKIRDQYSIRNSQIIYGHVGRFHKVKNHIFLLNIFKSLSLQIDSKLMLIGTGKESKKVFNWAKKHNIMDKIIHIEKSDYVEEYLSAMDVFIFPSFHEGFPGSVLEAQISGLPSIVSSSISKEIILTDNSHRLDLKSGIRHWSEFILSIPRNSIDSRIKAYSNKRLYDYNINQVIIEYENYYSNRLGHKI